MIIGHNFSEQVFTAKAIGEFINIFLNKQDGVVRGLNVVGNGNTITIQAGLAIVQGRMIEIVGEETLRVDGANGIYKVIIDINLNQNNTTNSLNQVHVLITNSDLIKENIIENGRRYQFEIARFTKENNGIRNIEKTNKVIEQTEMFRVFSEKLRILESNSSVVTRTEINNYLTKQEFERKKNVVKSGTTAPRLEDLEEGEIYIQYI